MDPNYLHEFNPARHGRCKTIVAGRICGLTSDWIAHTRFQDSKAETPFESFEVVEADAVFSELHVQLFGLSIRIEDARQFVEDAIREKLERL